MLEHPFLFAVLAALSQVLSIGILAGCASAGVWWTVYLPDTKRFMRWLLGIAILIDVACIAGMLLL
jgi:hypothetical protein